MSIPPKYAETHKELEKIIQNPPDLSDETKTDTLNNLAKDVTTPASEKALIDEIDALAGAALLVDTSFGNITALFRKVTTSGANPELVEDINGLMETWSGYHEEFTELLWLSREVAGTARAAADDFATDFIVFLGDDDTPLQVKKNEIANYMEKLSRDKDASEGLSQGFTNLKGDVEEFQVEWKRIIDKYDLDAISERIAELDKIILDLETTLNDLNNKIKALAIALGVLSTAAGVSAALGFICPFFWIGSLFIVAGVGVTAGFLKEAMDERDEVEGDLAVNKATRGMEQATLTAVKELKAGLDGSQNDFVTICDRLNAFAQVWAIIRADIQAIEEKLDYANGTESKALFHARLNTSAKLYATLSKALRRYQITVNRDDILAKRVGKH